VDVQLQKCHGETGAGDAKYVNTVKDPATGEMKPDTLVPPDFHQAGWKYATDKQALEKFIYTGSGEKPMPHWGISGLRPRDIDAVAAYIQQVIVAGTAKPQEQLPE
jgi:mono/diheme cytochrome c family protein